MTADSHSSPDPAVLALVRAMARLAAREDHDAEQRAIKELEGQRDGEGGQARKDDPARS